jgi:glycosyltransferase involved in cell wall biosynthesis
MRCIAKLPEERIETLQIGMTASRKHMSGTDRYFQELLRELPNHGIGVRGMVIGEPQAIEDPVAGIESFASEDAGRVARIRGARRAATRLLPGANLVVSHGAPHAFYVLDKFGRRPLVVHFHGPWALEGREEGVGRVMEFVRRAQEAAVYRRARRYIVLSQAFAETLQREFGVDASMVRVVPGGVNLQRFRGAAGAGEARARFGWPADRPIVLATRRLEPTKGIGALIEAIPLVRERVPQALFIITGTGALATALRARAQELRLGESVRFTGHVPSNDLPEMYGAADLSIVPSNAWEGFGLSVLESLACGTPALVTPVGGLPEAVRGLSASLILRDTSVSAIADGVVQMLLNRSTVPAREDCIAYAQRFGWPSIAARVAAVYREVVVPVLA